MTEGSTMLREQYFVTSEELMPSSTLWMTIRLASGPEVTIEFTKAGIGVSVDAARAPAFTGHDRAFVEAVDALRFIRELGPG